MKSIFFLMLVFIYANAVKPIALQFSGVNVTHTFIDGTKKQYKIERIVNEKCLNIPMDSEIFDEQNIIENIPNECKRTFITTKGVIQAFQINEKIKTVGEIEVLDFIYNKSSKEPSKYALVDTRKPSWFEKETIPSSINVPFEDFKYDIDFINEYQNAYKNLGIKILDKNKFDFKNAKTVIFFCNGDWCPLSSKSINYLLKIGYPASKMMWYRGGISSWSLLSLTTTIK